MSANKLRIDPLDLMVGRTPTGMPRLASGRALLGFAALSIVVLVLVFPSRSEYADAVGRDAVDTYSIAYLRIAMQTSPGDRHLRFVYVRKLMELGELDLALAAIEPLASSVPPDLVAKTTRFDILLGRMRTRAEGSPEREQAMQELLVELEELLRLPLGPVRLRALAGLALEFGAPSLAARFFVRLAETGPAAQAPDMLVEAAVAYRQAGDDWAAADAYDRAASRVVDRNRAVEWAILATRCLESMNRPDAAADLAEAWSKRIPESQDLLERTIELATRAGRPHGARDFGRVFAARVPTDEEMFMQMRRELAVGDVHSAYAIITALRAKHPADLVLLGVEARVAEWSGHPEMALSDWLLLEARGVRATEIPERWGKHTP